MCCCPRSVQPPRRWSHPAWALLAGRLSPLGRCQTASTPRLHAQPHRRGLRASVLRRRPSPLLGGPGRCVAQRRRRRGRSWEHRGRRAMPAHRLAAPWHALQRRRFELYSARRGRTATAEHSVVLLLSEELPAAVPVRARMPLWARQAWPLPEGAPGAPGAPRASALPPQPLLREVEAVRLWGWHLPASEPLRAPRRQGVQRCRPLPGAAGAL